jgi:hypothetical protein
MTAHILTAVAQKLLPGLVYRQHSAVVVQRLVREGRFFEKSPEVFLWTEAIAIT